jgi:hypothetical protein
MIKPDAFEDVPLEDMEKKDGPGPVIGIDWLQRYKTRLGNAIQSMHRLALLDDDGWVFVEGPHQNRFSLFQRETAPGNAYTFRLEGVVHGRADRFIYAIKDHDSHTRMPWEGGDALETNQYESYDDPESKETLTVVQSLFKTPLPKVVANRFVLGIQWISYDEQTQTHSLVFGSADHQFCVCPPDAVAVDLTMGVFVRQLDNKTCDLTLILKGSPGGNALSSAVLVDKYKEKIRERVLLWESVVADWNRFYGQTKNPKNAAFRK